MPIDDLLAETVVDVDFKVAKQFISNAMLITTVKVCNLSLGASERDVQEFFSFSGDIQYVEMQSDTELSQIAFVTFKDEQGAETAVLLSGATIVDMTVTVTLDPDYTLPPAASAPPQPSDKKTEGDQESALRKAEDVVSSMLAKGYNLGKESVNKAKAFDEKLQLTSTASAKVASLDKKIGLSEKISIGTSIVNDKVREVDEKLQVSEKAKSAFIAAEQTVSSAGSAIMKNRYVLTGATWVTGAFSRVTKAAGEVGQRTKEKVGNAEDEQRRNTADEFTQVHSPELHKVSDSGEQQPSKPAPAQGLIL